jgi:ABC-type Fe3+/spermidine/putrescine transport system ATPase subunit
LPAEVTADGLTVAGVRIGVKAPTGAETGTAVTVMSRPEDVRVHRPGGATNGAGLAGTVVSEHFAGATSLLRVRLDRLDVLVDAQRTQEADATGPGRDAGDRVEVVLSPDKVLIVE